MSCCSPSTSRDPAVLGVLIGVLVSSIIVYTFQFRFDAIDLYDVITPPRQIPRKIQIIQTNFSIDTDPMPFW